ncbi:MAG: hypothetical protein HOZ81_20280 [Streptomyces sp.]|nr:hypothetical protein [Streptomyces sp.]NUS81879.1 hypothetical protein [Streptomyces sp.]
MTYALIAALATALAPHGITDPDAITDAAEAATAVLGTDRCTCRASEHRRHHTHGPVDRCPWCTPAPPVRDEPKPAVTSLTAGGVL